MHSVETICQIYNFDLFQRAIRSMILFHDAGQQPPISYGITRAHTWPCTVCSSVYGFAQLPASASVLSTVKVDLAGL